MPLLIGLARHCGNGGIFMSLEVSTVIPKQRGKFKEVKSRWELQVIFFSLTTIKSMNKESGVLVEKT